jgi:signal transduction histidine kinase
MVTGSLAGRILFKIGPVSYGFVWAVTAVVIYYVFFFVVLPKLWSRTLQGFPMAMYSAILLVFFVLMAGGYLKRSSAANAQLTYRVLTGKGEIATWKDDISSKIIDAIRYLRTDTPANATVAVVPECHSINFFSDREDPLPFVSGYVPGVLEMFGEDDMISRFRKANVDYIVLVSRWTPEQGKSDFGIDYAVRLYEWMLKNYAVVKQIGPYPFTSSEFGIAILKKNEAASVVPR